MCSAQSNSQFGVQNWQLNLMLNVNNRWQARICVKSWIKIVDKIEADVVDKLSLKILHRWMKKNLSP